MKTRSEDKRKNSNLLNDLDSELKPDELRELLRTLYNLRCKIAHVRGNFSALDLDRLINVSEIISKIVGKWGEEIQNLIDTLQSDDSSNIMVVPHSFAIFDLKARPFCYYFRFFDIFHTIATRKCVKSLKKLISNTKNRKFT